MELRQLLKELKTSGIKLKSIAEKTGININTLYAITGGREINKDKEEYIISLIYSLYDSELAQLELLKQYRTKKEE